jgi:hypothetical protein
MVLQPKLVVEKDSLCQYNCLKHNPDSSGHVLIKSANASSTSLFNRNGKPKKCFNHFPRYRPSTTLHFNARTGCHRRCVPRAKITQVWLGPQNNIDFVFGMATLHLKLCGIMYIYILNLRSRVFISVAIKINTIPQILRNRSPPFHIIMELLSEI